MSEFRFFKTKMRITSVNVRQELHGDDHVLAMDIGLEFNQSNRSLDKLDPLLLQTFFWNNGQGQLDGVDKVTDYPNLRFEHLAMPIKWLDEFTEGLFCIHHGEDDDNDIVIKDAEINNIRMAFKEGGTTVYNARVQCHPDEDDVARICTVLQSDVTCTLDSDPDEDVPVAPPAKKTTRKKKGAGQQQTFDDAQVADIKDAMEACEK
jgi:hypothetical protein